MARHLRIGFDFDDVLIGTAKCTLDIYNKEYGTKLTFDNWYNFDPISTWAANTLEEVTDRVVNILRSDNFLKTIEPIKESQKTLRYLKSIGCSLFIVTGRPESMRDYTLKIVDRHFPSLFDESSLYFTDYFEKGGKKLSKSDIVDSLELTHFIDDQVEHVNSIVGTGVTTILFSNNYPWNKEGYCNGIVKLSGWDELGPLINTGFIA